MIIYLDESYDSKKEYFILGALFNPHHKSLLKRVKKIKNEENFYENNVNYKEIKYNNCYCKKNFIVASRIFDEFFNSTSYFRAIVIKTSKLNLNRFGKSYESEKIKWARAYKKFSEMLIKYNSGKIFNGVLLTDGMTRCNGDRFINAMEQEFCIPNKFDDDGSIAPTLKHIDEVSSCLEQYQVIQVNDLLMGVIINNLVPTKNHWKKR